MQHELSTESANPASEDLDGLSTLELVQLINREDATIAAAVATQAEAIAAAIDGIAERLARQGRLFYVGAGTSGRLGVLDASECPPTFNTDPGQVQGFIAGGDHALRHSVEGAEDLPEAGAADLAKAGFSAKDAVVGIAASGSTPYACGALEHARAEGGLCIGFCCNEIARIADHADIMIRPIVGPEVLAGSTRMKAGTATKMVLNMLSTGVMVRLGKTYGNLMVDLRASNRKLEDRSLRILKHLTGLAETAAREQLAAAGGELKTAVLAAKLKLDVAGARARLAAANGRLREALEAND
ncbi:MAG: N-acetylmuramic acid 6-phosphate etherase [Pseudomonadota bacterium]